MPNVNTIVPKDLLADVFSAIKLRPASWNLPQHKLPYGASFSWLLTRKAQRISRGTWEAVIHARLHSVVFKRDKSTLGRRVEAIMSALLGTGLRAAGDWKERRALILGKGARERLVLFEAKTLLAIQRSHRRAGIGDDTCVVLS